MSRLEHAVDGIKTQQDHRRTWQEGDSAEKIANYILEETAELVEAIQVSFLTGDVFSVASEIADILFLAHRLCQELGFDPADLIEMKTIRNSMKYNDAVLNNGYSPIEAALVAKKMWGAMGGDVAFSHAYLECIVVDSHDE
jgi:NTP pyrophosphatase (non-canonical NTP hydrolase)